MESLAASSCNYVWIILEWVPGGGPRCHKLELQFGYWLLLKFSLGLSTVGGRPRSPEAGSSASSPMIGVWRLQGILQHLTECV